MVNPHEFRLIEVVLAELIKSENYGSYSEKMTVFIYNYVVTKIATFF